MTVAFSTSSGESGVDLPTSAVTMGTRTGVGSVSSRTGAGSVGSQTGADSVGSRKEWPLERTRWAPGLEQALERPQGQQNCPPGLQEKLWTVKHNPSSSSA